MPRRGLFVPKLHEKNVRRLYFQANRLHMPVSKLLNLIVGTGLEYLEAVNNPDEWDEYTVVRLEEGMHCTCRHFVEHGGCYHIDMVRKHTQEEP